MCVGVCSGSGDAVQRLWTSRTGSGQRVLQGPRQSVYGRPVRLGLVAMRPPTFTDADAARLPRIPRRRFTQRHTHRHTHITLTIVRRFAYSIVAWVEAIRIDISRAGCKPPRAELTHVCHNNQLTHSGTGLTMNLATELDTLHDSYYYNV